MHNKTYLSSIDKERKRLTKIELSSIDNLKDSLNQLEDQINNVGDALDATTVADDLLSQDLTSVQELGEELKVAVSELEKDYENYKDLEKQLEDVTTKLVDLYQMKTEDVVSEFDKNAEALGLKPGDIPERNLVVELNIEAEKVTDKAFKRLNDDNSAVEAERLINEYK